MTTETYLDKALSESREREEKATPGRWKLWANEVRWDKGGDSDLDKSVHVVLTQNPRTFDTQWIAHARTWEPRFRRMLERAKAALDEAHPITCTDNVDERCLICHALDHLEAIAKEGVTGVSKLEFTPGHFSSLPYGRFSVQAEAARIAQEIFDAWLAEQPVVYAEKPDRGGELWDRNQATNDTHRARLVAIEPLEKKP